MLKKMKIKNINSLVILMYVKQKQLNDPKHTPMLLWSLCDYEVVS